MKKVLIFTLTFWLLIVGISFLWNMDVAREEQRHVTLQTAHTFLTQVILTREWNADHGGIYVPVTADMTPNPYLDDHLRDIQVSKDLQLTKVNPSFMTRQLSEIAAKRQGVQFHLTSLQPIRPQNSPSEWEKKALELFERGVKEVGETINNPPNTDFIYMVPLITEKSCLKCHSSQGYKEGDIRGGISVTLTNIHTLQLLPMTMGHIGIGSIGVIFIILFWIKLSSAYGIIQRQAVIDSLTNIDGNNTWADYPGFAVDEEAIYITNNMFTFVGANSGVRLWIVDKGTTSGFYSGGPISQSIYDPYNAGASGYELTTQPAHVFNSPTTLPTSVGTFLVGYSGLASGSTEAIQVVRVDNPLVSPTFTTNYVFIGDIDSGASMPDAPQNN